MIKTVGELRAALVDVPGGMKVILRVADSDGCVQFMCCPSSAIPDEGCGEVEAFIIDGQDGECEHGTDSLSCAECKTEQEEN